MNNSSAGNKFYGIDTNDWIGVVVEFADTKNQTSGTQGWGWRYKVAIMGFHPTETTVLPNDKITYALTALPTTAGSGAGERLRTPRISQGDVVMGRFLDGDKRQVPVITGLLGRTSGTKFGTGRWDSKTGYVDGAKSLGLVGSETNEAPGPCTSSTKSLSSKKDKVKGAAGGLLSKAMGIKGLGVGVFDKVGGLNRLDFGSVANIAGTAIGGPVGGIVAETVVNEIT